MTNNRISIIGHFGKGKHLLNGQTVKTKIIAEELVRRFGKEYIKEIDTHGGIKTLFKAPVHIIGSLKQSKNVIILPAHNGLRVYAPLLAFGKVFYKDRGLHYVVIGGWLPGFLEKRKYLAKSLRAFNGIYVETNTMKNALEKQGFSNVIVMPNCKKLNILGEDELIYPKNLPYRLCMFSRVMKEKGIETAVKVVKDVNDRLGYIAYCLDIYGQIDQGQKEWFSELQENMPEYISYKGCVDADKSVEVLCGYFALLFPTHFYTEGIPGTIIDAYAAGVPVISAKWESYEDVVDEGKTGKGYAFDDINELKELLMRIESSPEILLSIKQNCLDKAKNYMVENAMERMFERLNAM